MKDTERDNLTDDTHTEDAEAAETTPSEAPGGDESDPASEASSGSIESLIEEKIQDYSEQIERLQAEVSEHKDKHLRSVAEFSNYRKRQERQREQQTWLAKSRVIERLLDPLDDFQRALTCLPDQYADSEWIKGILLIEQKLRGLLQQWQVRPIEALGEPFDPRLHDALLREPSDEYSEDLVSEVMKTGYMLEDQVLRPAVVKVSAGPSEEE